MLKEISMGYALSMKGKQEMDKLRRTKKWSKYDHQWCYKANVSQSTLKRFWGVLDGGVSESTFIAICEAAGLEDVAEKWDWLVEQEKIDSTHPHDLKSLDDMQIINSSSELQSQPLFISPNSAYTLRVRCQAHLTQPEQEIINLILEDLQENLLNKPCFARLIPHHTPLESSNPPQYLCIITISGHVNPDHKMMVDAILEELKQYTAMDDILIQWKTPDNQENITE